MDVSIIIINYNTLDLTKDCIDSVFNHTTGVLYEVILVDNGSTDGSKSVFEKDTRIKYYYNPTNLGFGNANNIGFKLASGKYIFLLNSDTYLINNAVYLIWKQMEDLESLGYNNIACAGSMLLDRDGRVIHSYARFPSMIQALIKESVLLFLWRIHIIRNIPSSSNYDYETNSRASFFDVDYITGADLMIRSDVAKQFGLFDPEFFMYYEETEMQHRYMLKGYRRIICTAPQIVHLEGKSDNSLSYNKKTTIMRSRLLYYKKTHSALQYKLFSFIYKFIYITMHIISFPFVSGKFSEKVQHIYSTLKM